MDPAELYFRNNCMQECGTRDVLNKYVEQIKWKPNEIVLDIGCGPGNVTVGVLYQLLKNNVKQLIGVDKSREMVEFAQKTYDEYSMITFDVLDIENTNDCRNYLHKFDKIFSFFCLHWVCNKLDALVNMHSMLNSNGVILIHYVTNNLMFDTYKYLDVEWKKYIDKIAVLWAKSQSHHTEDEIKTIFVKAGFKIISIEQSIIKYKFPDFSSILNAVKVVDRMYDILPQHLQGKYFMHVKDKICESKYVILCPTTGKATFVYHTNTVHAIKDKNFTRVKLVIDNNI